MCQDAVESYLDAHFEGATKKELAKNLGISIYNVNKNILRLRKRAKVWQKGKRKEQDERKSSIVWATWRSL